MKFTAVAALAMAALVSAQSRSDIPACALPCLDDAVKSSTSCSTTDFTCICKKENFSKVQGAATGCVIEKCGSDVAISKVLPATEKLCAAAAAGSGSGASSAAATTAAATTAAATSAEASSAEATSAPATTEQATTAAIQPTGSSNGTAPTTSAPVQAGAAGFAPVGGLAMLAIAALAL